MPRVGRKRVSRKRKSPYSSSNQIMGWPKLKRSANVDSLLPRMTRKTVHWAASVPCAITHKCTSPNLGKYQQISFKMNGFNNPGQYALVGTAAPVNIVQMRAPQELQTMANYYKTYRVLGAKMTVRIIQNVANTSNYIKFALTGTAKQPDAPLVSEEDSTREVWDYMVPPSSKPSRIVHLNSSPPGETKSATLSKSWRVDNLDFPVTTDPSELDADMVRGTTLVGWTVADPSNTTWCTLHLMAPLSPQGDAEETYHLEVNIEYDTLFYNRLIDHIVHQV